MKGVEANSLLRPVVSRFFRWQFTRNDPEFTTRSEARVDSFGLKQTCCGILALSYSL